MKKLLIMTGVAAFAFGAFAFSNGTGFDKLNNGESFPGTYWNNPSNLEASVTSYADSGETAYSTRPAYFVDNNVPQTNFLAIDSASAADPLKRFVETTEGPKAIGNGLYLDTLVKFTAVSTDSTETMGTSDENAKLAIWAQTSETSEKTTTVTNFVVQAGYVTANNITSTNYVMTAPTNNFDYTAWHRLTVKAISDIGGDHAGFVVFVDGIALEREDGAAIADEGALTLNTVAGKFANAVLPSRRSSNWDDYQTLQAVSFSGNGKIDDVSFTDVAPKFAADATVYTVTWGTGITGVSYNSTAIVKDAENEIPAGASFELVVALDPGYVLEAPNASGCTVTGNGNTFTVSGATAGASIEFTAFQPAASVVVGNTTTYYASFADAFDDAAQTAGGKITLSTGATLIKALRLQSNTEVIVDLNGQTITGAVNRAVFNIEAGTLIITNSSALATGEVTAGANGQVAMLGGGLTKIYGGKFTGDFEADGVAKDKALELYGGKYDAATWGGKSDVEEVAKADVTGPDENGYFTVGGEEPVDTPVAVPTAVTGLVYDGTEQTGVEAAGTGYTLTGNTGTNAGEYTATATLADGYVWADESKEAKSIPWTIAKKTVTATITLAPASATYDAEKNTVDDYTDATVTFGDDTLANTDYTVTGLDTAVAEAGEFTITVAPAASGSNYTFDTVTAKLTVTAAVQPEPVKVEPGATAESDTEAAAKAVEFVAPAAVTEAGVNAEAYAALFKQKTSYNETSGKWETTYELTADAVAGLTTEVDADVKAITPTAAEATFTGTPGIYYHTVSGTSVTALTGDNNWAMAGADGSVTLTLPKAGGTSGFYKIEASATK